MRQNSYACNKFPVHFTFRAAEDAPRAAEEEAKRLRRQQEREEQEERERIKNAAPVKVALKMGLGGKKSTSKTTAFNTAEEAKQPRAIIPIDFSEEEKLAMGISGTTPTAPSTSTAAATPSAPAMGDKAIANQIPTEKGALFAYSLDWAVIKKSGILDTIILPWVRKKIEEYLGESEETLCSFIMSKLTAQNSPNDLVVELEAVLDSDAEKFVTKLQQILIFQSLKVAAG